MTAPRIGPAQALLVLAAWLLLTVGAGLALGDGGHAPLAASAARGIGIPWLLAAALVIAVAWRAGPAAMGLRLPSPISSLRLAWLPLAYVGLMLAFDLALGLPPAQTVAIVACNMLLVAVSEELMFRSILFGGMRVRLGLWPAVLLTSLLFGLVHTLNVFGTGQLDQALMQSLTAFMQGLAYLAIRIRTGSVWPMVVVHALWDFSLMIAQLAHPAGTAGTHWSILPVMLVLPVFGYGLFLLRHAGRDQGASPETAAATRHPPPHQEKTP